MGFGRVYTLTLISGAVEWSHQVGVDAVELHTGQYANQTDDACSGECAP